MPPEVAQPPERRARDTIAEAGLAAIPYAGGSLSVLYRLLGTGLEKRRETWERELVDALNDVIRRVEGLGLADLADNEQFLDAVAAASAAALATADQDKLAALRNAVLNTAIPSDLGPATQAIFMTHVRDFTPFHLRVLKLLDAQYQWLEERGYAKQWPGPDTPIARAVAIGLPELEGEGELARQLGNDLDAAGLAQVGKYWGKPFGGTTPALVTERGKAFLRFITDPR